MKIFKTSRIRVEQLQEDARNFLVQTYGQFGQLFSPSSAFGQLLTVMIDLTKLVFYYIEDAMTELNIYTATRDTSIKSLSRLTGHNPSRGLAASGTLSLVLKESVSSELYSETLILPNYTRITNKSNGYTYTIFLNTEDLRMSPGVPYEVKVYQGQIETQTVTGTGRPLQSYNLKIKKGSLVDSNFVRVYVNTEEWKVYDSLYDVPYNAKGVVVKTGIEEGIDIFFGNTYFGAIPVLGSQIVVEYLSNVGSFGNLPRTTESFSFIDSGFDVLGNSVDLNSLVEISVSKRILFGADPEPLELTKVLAPKVSRSFVLANTDNYVYFFEKMNMFSIIDASVSLKDENVIELFLIPDINKRKPANLSYFNTPLELFYLSSDEHQRIYDMIEESGQKLLSTEHQILQPKITKYVLNIIINAYEGYSKDLIRTTITEKIGSYFLNNRRRDKIPKSDLIAVIETVEGVDSVDLWFISEQNEIFKSDPLNSAEPDHGIDNFGNILIGPNEFPIIRGGFKDREGNMFEEFPSKNTLSSLNIFFEKDTPKNLSMTIHSTKLQNLKREL